MLNFFLIYVYALNSRYFIIIDDIWNEDVWDVIICAFPENHNGSRVITTTRVERVASACCTNRHECIYKMDPLDKQDSRKLFFARIFGSEDACPSELKEVSSQILKKCDGLPLAIITIASLLASQATRVKEYWEYVQNSMGSIVGRDRRLGVMRQILNLSYKDLPPTLKTCFLYLGAYREDTVVWRDDLVRQWVAEGFVGGMHGDAVNCFHELVNRSMIQPVMMSYDGEVLSCRVHDMMLDLIIRKYTEEENFLTVVKNSSQGIKVRGSTHNIRRLFHQPDEERRHLMRWMPAMNVDLSKVRSFSACGNSTQGHIPPLSSFRFIRVLILEFLFAPEATVAETVDLREICKLFQLRYLKIRSEIELLLPSQIRRLQHLETLEIVSVLPPRSLISIALPSDIVQLPCLSYLGILPEMAKLPDGIGAMRSLRSLAFFVLDENSLENIRGIRNLTNLKELYVRVPMDQRFEDTAEARVDVLCSSLPEHSADCKLYLNALSSEAWFPGVPQWISRLQKLYSLEIGVDQLCREGIAVLARLPALVRLDLSIRGVPRERITFSGEGFPELKRLIITCRTLCLIFEPGAMPVLQRLKLEFNVDAAGAEQGGYGNVIAGVDNLSALKQITARIGGFGDATNAKDSGRRAAAVSALKDAIGSLPSPVEFDITCMQGRYGLR